MFTTPEGLFELTVMFFGLMNSLAIFQTMMNEILWNLINTGKIVSFIDDIIIRTEGEEVSQIRYSLVMILELNSISEVQYKDMMIDR